MKNWTLAEEKEVKTLGTLGQLIVSKANQLENCSGPCPLSDELAKEINHLSKAIALVARSVKNYSYED